MRLNWLFAVMKWTLALLFLGGLLLGIFRLNNRDAQEANSEHIESRRPTSSAFVGIDQEQAERYGLEVRPAQAIEWYERVAVFGRVVPNPRATVEVRSPFAGTLQTAPGSPWLQLGQRVHARETIGLIDVRVSPEIKLDLENKLAEARITQRGAEEEVKLQQSRVDSLRAVTSEQILSRTQLDTALIQLAQARNQMATAQAAAQLWQQALEQIGHRADGKSSSWIEPLVAPADGEITELAALPGTAVEPGGLIARLVDFRRPLVRLDLPPELLTNGVPRKANVIATTFGPSALRGLLAASDTADAMQAASASLLGPAPQVDVASQFVGYWYQVDSLADSTLPSGELNAAEQSAHASALWRPGLQVKALLPVGHGEPKAAVAIPAEAVLYHEGRSLVYVRLEPGKFERRPVELLEREGECWIVARQREQLPTGLAAGEEVVCRQAQVLLSEEFRGEASGDDD